MNNNAMRATPSLRIRRGGTDIREIAHGRAPRLTAATAAVAVAAARDRERPIRIFPPARRLLRIAPWTAPWTAPCDRA